MGGRQEESLEGRWTGLGRARSYRSMAVPKSQGLDQKSTLCQGLDLMLSSCPLPPLGRGRWASGGAGTLSGPGLCCWGGG